MSEEILTTDLDDEKKSEEIQINSLDEDVDSVLSLPFGQELTSQETYPISATEQSNFVILAGATGCGKTTLVTSLYQHFLQDVPERYYLAGSQTLQAFEQRAYLSRISSKKANPQMQRTVSGSLDSILHLRIWDSLTNVHKNLLLTDFSGEDYVNVSANIISAKEDFKIVRAAKFVIIIIDGENIASKFKHSELQKVIHILRTFNDAKLLQLKVPIIVVISKYDLVFKQYKANLELEQFVQNIPKKIGSQIPSISSQIILKCVAAMPDNQEDIPVGYGIADILNLLLTPCDNKNDLSVQISTSVSISEFNLFQERVLK